MLRDANFDFCCARAIFLLMDGLMARSNSVLRYHFCDTFVHNILELSHVDDCDTIGLVSDHGKTRQVGYWLMCRL